jgi:uncharacterized membrane protein
MVGERAADEEKPNRLLAAVSYLFMPYSAAIPLIAKDRYSRFHAARASVLFFIELLALIGLLYFAFSDLISSFSSAIKSDSPVTAIRDMFVYIAKLSLPLLVLTAINLALGFFAAREEAISIPVVDPIANKLMDKPLVLISIVIAAVAVVVVVFFVTIYPPTGLLGLLRPNVNVPLETIMRCEAGTRTTAEKTVGNSTEVIQLNVDRRDGQYCVFSSPQAETEPPSEFSEKFWFNMKGELCKYYKKENGATVQLNLC